ncbi:hypothetical protein ACQ4LE_003859 [Meloidogyne hapla]
MRILGADCGFKEFNFGMNQQRTSENHCADKEEILMPYLEAMANFREVVRNDLLPLLSLSPLQAGGFGQLPAGGFFFLFPPASRWLLPTASRGDSSFSSFPPASRWLRPTASRGVLLSLSPLQAGGFGQLPAGGFFFLNWWNHQTTTTMKLHSVRHILTVITGSTSSSIVEHLGLLG